MDPMQSKSALPSEASAKDGQPPKKDYTLVVILSFTTILGVVIALFFYFQNQQLRKQLLVTPSPIASVPSTPSPTPVPVNLPIVSTPTVNSVITSPLKITGTVPAGWMFEGSFPIKLIDSKNKVLVQTVAKEIVGGSWQEDTPASFSATLTFKNATGSGTLILEKDNPSGQPQNDTTFEVPIQF